MNKRKLALDIAQKSFNGRLDKSGKPYFDHLARVANNAEKFYRVDDDDSVYIVALLHDLLEDCPEWSAASIGVLFGTEISSVVELLTKTVGQSYEDYIEGILNNEIALIVKRFDLEDNMDIRRLENISDKDLERIAKYHKAYIRILSAMNCHDQ